MHPRPQAAIDLGSNSALLAVVQGDRLLHDEAKVVGLGRGLRDGGVFRPDRRRAAMDVLVAYARTAVRFGVEPHEVIAVATSASRRASDAPAFFEDVRRRTGLCFRVIDGEEEARLAFVGARFDLELPGPVLVVDLGGGSTELAVGTEAPIFRRSLPLGVVRLTEEVLGPEVRPATEADRQAMIATVDAALPPSPDLGDAQVIGLAGTITTLAAQHGRAARFDRARIHGARLDDSALAEMERALMGLDAEQRRALVKVSPQRADYLLAGAVIARRVLRWAGRRALVVSTGGIRFGAILDARARSVSG